MYYPYVRGKQYELITIRETCSILSRAGFTPVIEPVRETLHGLNRALDALIEVDGSAVVIVNPNHGELSGAGSPLSQMLVEKFHDKDISAGILLTADTTVDEASQYYSLHAQQRPVFVHAGFSDPKGLLERLSLFGSGNERHIFIEKFCGKLYQRNFRNTNRVLVRDGFKKKRNADYTHEPIEFFSDLHLTYRDEGMDGFGDFLVVGDEFSESGGPAYAVAIHLTFIDPEQDDAMFVHHFVSDTQDTPKDPAGKFGEALEKLVREVERKESKFVMTSALSEFLAFHLAGHFPGLGYVKKLSMSHHIETLATYLATNPAA